MMYFNIIHRTAVAELAEGPYYEIYKRQQDMAHSLGMKTTIAIQYSDLFDETVLADARAYQAEFGDELALSLHRLAGPELDELASGLNPIWLFDVSKKRQILSLILNKWKDVFGSYPKGVTSYHFDSSSLNILKQIAPEVETVIGGCFEEGVRVFHGCNHSWYLFNEGMPWGPWYPSKGHSLRPAKNEADAAGVVALPHLCRDMSLSYEGRNDFWASHPPNVIRGMGNDASFCPYDLNLIDQYRMQEKFNNNESYYNTFVSSSWLDWNHNSEYPPEVSWTLYEKMLAYCSELKSKGELTDMTISEYGAHYRKQNPIQYKKPDVYWAKEMLYGSGKHYFWYIDSTRRMLFDTTQGGSIGDLRPYIGGLDGSTGPDTPNREIGTFPYLIQSQYRTGAAHHYEDGARTTLLLTHKGETVDLCHYPTKGSDIIRDGGCVIFKLTPATIKFDDGLIVKVTTSIHCYDDGQTKFERKIELPSDYNSELLVTEYLKGCYGKTEYAEDMHAISLNIDNKIERNFDYSGQEFSVPQGRTVSAIVPQLNVTVGLSADDTVSESCSARIGHLFSPYYTLKINYKISKTRSISTWLQLTS